MSVAAFILGAVPATAAVEIDAVASENTVVLRIEIEPSADFDGAAYSDLRFALQRTPHEIVEADRDVDQMVEVSFGGGKIDDAQNKRAVRLRREWAVAIDEALQRLYGSAKVTLSVVFPESEEKALLAQHGDWPTIKKVFAGSATPDDARMKMLLKYRRRLTDALLAIAWIRMRQDPPGAADDRMDFFETEPVGSVTRTSDLDVTTVGYNCAAAVAYFNDYFRRAFCAESGIVLDSNVYCEIYKVHDDVPSPIEMIRDGDDSNPACQDAMALAKLRRYASPDEWLKVSSALTNFPSVRSAATYYEFFETRLREQQAQAASTVGAPDASCRVPPSEAAAEMLASNRLYAERLAALRNSLWNTSASVDRVKFEQSAANLFANESYNSQGPLIHVLGIIQGKKEELIHGRDQEWSGAITPEQLLNSVNEQIGDALKDLTHYDGHAPLGEALYKSAKYIDRALQGVWLMQARDPAVGSNPQGDRSRTLLETIFSKAEQYDLETLLRLRGGSEGDELVFTPEGIRIRQPYAYREMSDADRARNAQTSSPGIKSYADFRNKLIAAVTDINLRARRSMQPRSCEYSLP